MQKIRLPALPLEKSCHVGKDLAHLVGSDDRHSHRVLAVVYKVGRCADNKVIFQFIDLYA